MLGSETSDYASENVVQLMALCESESARVSCSRTVDHGAFHVLARPGHTAAGAVVVLLSCGKPTQERTVRTHCNKVMYAMSANSVLKVYTLSEL